MSIRRVFGYGSLLNRESLLLTVPSARNIRPAYIKGFKRVFNKHSETRKRDDARSPYVALNIVKSPDQRVNGVVFEMDEVDFNDLVKREKGYDLVQVEIIDLDTEEEIGEAGAFVAKVDNVRVNVLDLAQLDYIETCIDGAKELGETFYEEFISTTFIGEKTLKEVPELSGKL